MEEITYLHWEDYYQKTWKPKYDYMLDIKTKTSLSTKELHKILVDFYNATRILLITYLRNNGHFYNKNSMIIKVAFRIGFLEDGEGMIIITDMLAHPDRYDREKIISYCLYEKFLVFESINEKMAELLER